MPQPDHKHTRESYEVKRRKVYEQPDWERDIASYTRYKELSVKYPNNVHAQKFMENILARWPGKEHLFN